MLQKLCYYTATAILLTASATGCASKPDLKKAQSLVETSLNHWMRGEKPDSLASEGIDFTDEDWLAGHKLLGFSIQSTAIPLQQGPRVVVKLHVENESGEKREHEIAYEVILADKSMAKIGRDAFHVP